MVRVHVVVSGRVQGVWYRESCRQQAVASGVSGWVRNRADGRVEAALEGEREAVDAVLRWMAEGPPLAEVTSVATTDELVVGEVGFRTR
ncbi:MAG TPA: acylphosphatase [Acidimicrobiales bacterium]